MSNHYYSEKPTVESSRRNWVSTLRGMKMSFTSDAGVFSKKEVDFGTQLLLNTFSISENGNSILDMGCGYGPVGLTLGKEFPDFNVVMVDVNERALELSEHNAKSNSVKNVTIKKSNLFNNLEGESFSYILSNPPIRAGKQVVHQLFEEAFDHLDENGELWIVIQKKQGAPSALEKLRELFQEVSVEKKSKGYYIIKSKKR